MCLLIYLLGYNKYLLEVSFEKMASVMAVVAFSCLLFNDKWHSLGPLLEISFVETYVNIDALIAACVLYDLCLGRRWNLVQSKWSQWFFHMERVSIVWLKQTPLRQRDRAVSVFHCAPMCLKLYKMKSHYTFDNSPTSN